jgi:hypothetical protein
VLFKYIKYSTANLINSSPLLDLRPTSLMEDTIYPHKVGPAAAQNEINKILSCCPPCFPLKASLKLAENPV